VKAVAALALVDAPLGGYLDKDMEGESLISALLENFLSRERVGTAGAALPQSFFSLSWSFWFSESFCQVWSWCRFAPSTPSFPGAHMPGIVELPVPVDGNPSFFLPAPPIPR
jgi:hypothetical protein